MQLGNLTFLLAFIQPLSEFKELVIVIICIVHAASVASLFRPVLYGIHQTQLNAEN